MNNFDSKSKVANEMTKIFDETRHLSNTMFKKSTEKVKQQTIVYDTLKKQPKPKKGTAVEFISGGTVETGYRWADTYLTAVLNFADAITPGGLVLVGGTTQEENICRCTNLYESLTIGECQRSYYRENAKNWNNGICLDKVIYSADVLVFRDDETYELVDLKCFDVITCPAPCGYIKNEKTAMSIYTKRIRNIITSAMINNVECLVLGAWGCGAFGQDPVLVSRAFVKVLNEYSGAFKKIIFAFRPTPGLVSSNASTTNVFIKEFTNGYKWGVEDGIR